LSVTFRCIDDVLSLNNSRFCDFVDRIYHIELKIKDTADTDRSDSYLSLHLEIDSKGDRERNLTTKEIISIFLCELSRASFFSFFLRSPGMKSASCE
jgi:hypothetical protein